jgi:hypothetical protein
MSGYGEDYREQRHQEYVRRHAPQDLWDKIKNNPETLRWYVARAVDAETELQELKDALRSLKRLLK